MLQLITTPPAQGALPTDAAVLPASSPAGFNAPVQPANPQGFVLNAEALLAGAPLAEVLPGAVEDTTLDPALLSTTTTDDSNTPEPTDAVAQLPLDPSLQQQELSAEQWLLSMLGQRQFTVQARDGDSSEGAVQPPTNAVGGQGSAQPVIPAVIAALSSGTDNAVMPLPVAKKDTDSDALSALLATLGSSGDQAAAPTTLDSASSQTVSALSSTSTSVTPQPQDLTQAQLPQLERHLKLQAPEAKWGEQMLAALKDNVELQLQQKVQSATIRLDPPELGSMEILLSHESGRLSVQIAASNGDVARLLNTTSERLRQELVGQNFLQVNVQVSSDSSGQQGQQHARQRLPLEEAILAAAPSSESEQRQGKTGDDVLVTV